MKKSSLASAILAWSNIFGDRLINQSEATKRYGGTTFGNNRVIDGAIILNNEAEIIQAISIANRYKIPVYPISTGNNWGYGSSAPVEQHNVIFDLSKMNEVIECDEDLGLVQVQPGVTYSQLYQYLNENDLELLVPTIGAGEHCSLIGNVLERGFGIVPLTDHFLSVMALRAVLADGSIYHPEFSVQGAHKINQCYKWGIGPYIDGLFTQAAFGVVTEMTIALKPKPKKIMPFLFRIKNKNFDQVMEDIKTINQDVGEDNISNIKLINDRHLHALLYKQEYKSESQVTPQKMINKQLHSVQLKGDWFGFGAIYSSAIMTTAIKKQIRKQLKSNVEGLTFLNPALIHAVKKILSKIHWLNKLSLAKKVQLLDGIIKIFEGIPESDALRILYYKSKSQSPLEMHPQKDGCGLKWFVPLVPFKTNDIVCAKDLITSVCMEFGIEPILTITPLSMRVVAITLPLIFDGRTQNQISNANACYRALHTTCKEKGYLSYRLNIDDMSLIFDKNSDYCQTLMKLKHALDPNNIIAPGRYGALSADKDPLASHNP